MRIQHNIMAMNAYRNYNTNTSALSKNLEKLSSGYKINRAGDDAAGLAISEKMRAQITGLNAASKNVKDGISLVKTAEGAMQEIQDMLNRMEYLATQSANGTYDDDVDRYNLQKEVTQLKSEINRIAESANFNGIALLDGSLDGGSASSAMEDVAVTPEVDGINPAEAPQAGEYSINLKDLTAKLGSTAKTATINVTVAGQTIATIGLSASSSGASVKIGSGITVAVASAVSAAGSITIGSEKFTVEVGTDKITLKMKNPPKAEFTQDMTVTYAAKTAGSVAQFGANSGSPTLSNNAWTDSVTVDKKAIFAEDRRLASGKFSLSGVADGMQLQIGKDVYTFAVGADSKYAKAGGNVIDLTKVNKTGTDLDKEAARRLSEAAKNNSMFKVTVDNATSDVHLTEIDGKVDYEKNNLVGKTDTATDSADGWKGLVKKGMAGSAGGAATGLSLQIGDTSESYNQLNVSVGDMHTYGAMNIDGIDIGTQGGAQSAISVIKDAINYVSGIRGDLGATQNRLEHTANNLSVMAENIQDAESTIRDTDVAEEMMAYTKNNILVQSAQAMLAQANAVPQGVLQLLG